MSLLDNKENPFHTLKSTCLLMCGLMFIHAAVGQDQAALEQAVSKAIDAAGNDPVSVEAAIRGVMDQTNPSAAGMKVIASAAIKKAAVFNQRGLMASVSQGVAKATLSQSLKTGLNPLQATAVVSEGLVESAMETTARRGGNSIGTAKAVSQATMQAVVETSGGLGIPTQDAANAAAFGTMNATMDVTVDFGNNTNSMAREVTEGLATGAIVAAKRIEANPEAMASAALTGAVDSIFVQSEKANINPDPIVKGAQAGFNQALAANLVENTSPARESSEPNNDVIGSFLSFSGKVILLYDQDNEMWTIQLLIEEELPEPDILFELQLEGKTVSREPKSLPVFELGPDLSEDKVGEYRIIAKNKDGNEVLNVPKRVNLINKPRPPVSPFN